MTKYKCTNHRATNPRYKSVLPFPPFRPVLVEHLSITRSTSVLNPLSMALHLTREVFNTSQLLMGLWWHMFGWSAKCETPVQEYHLAVIRQNGRTDFLSGDLQLGGLCTCIQVIDPEFDPGHVSSFSVFLSWASNVYLQSGQLSSYHKEQWEDACSRNSLMEKTDMHETW